MNPADQIALASLGVAVLSAIVTVVLTVVVWRSGTRGQEQAQQILEVLQGLVTANRLDELALKARDLRSREHLDLVLGETRQIVERVDGVTAGSAVRVFEAYWANPAIPITEARAGVPEAVRIVQDNLDAKLAGSSRVIDELIAFIRNCSRANTFEAHRVAAWLLDQYHLGRPIVDTEVRRLLQDAPSDLFGALLNGLDSIHGPLPIPMRVNVLAGVAAAYLDRIGLYPIKSADLAKAALTRETDFRDLSHTVISGLALVLHRGNLRGLARWDSEGCSVNADCSAALVVACAGAASFADDHLAMRCLENMERMKIVPAELSTFGRAYQYGIAKFAEHQPQLLDRFWPEGAALATVES